MTHMKTTIELPESLFHEAKATAIRRKTTLKALITHALEREVMPQEKDDSFEVDEDGLPYLPSRGVTVTSEIVNKIRDQEEI